MDSLRSADDDETTQETRVPISQPATALRQAQGRLFVSPRHVRWERQHDPETGEDQLRIVDVQTGEVIAIVRSLFDAWLS